MISLTGWGEGEFRTVQDCLCATKRVGMVVHQKQHIRLRRFSVEALLERIFTVKLPDSVECDNNQDTSQS